MKCLVEMAIQHSSPNGSLIGRNVGGGIKSCLSTPGPTWRLLLRDAMHLSFLLKCNGSHSELLSTISIAAWHSVKEQRISEFLETCSRDANTSSAAF